MRRTSSIPLPLFFFSLFFSLLYRPLSFFRVASDDAGSKDKTTPTPPRRTTTRMEQLMIQAGMERPLECFAAQSGMLSHDGESFGKCPAGYGSVQGAGGVADDETSETYEQTTQGLCLPTYQSSPSICSVSSLLHFISMYLQSIGSHDRWEPTTSGRLLGAGTCRMVYRQGIVPFPLWACCAKDVSQLPRRRSKCMEYCYGVLRLGSSGCYQVGQ